MSGWNTTRDYEKEKMLKGKIIRTFYSSDNFSTGVISATNGDPLEKDCRFSINAEVNLGDEIILKGDWFNDPKWGWQFKANAIEYPEINVSSPDGLADYLSKEKSFRGIGEVKAKLIAENFSENFDEIIRNSPEQIAEIAKLPVDTVLEIQSAWCERADVNAISIWLASYGLTPGQIKKIAKQFGNSAKEKIERNPYCIMDAIDGIGFLTNDIIALKMGVDAYDPTRLGKGLMHVVNQNHDEQGHTYIPRQALIQHTIKALYLDSLESETLLNKTVDGLCQLDLLVSIDINGEAYVGSKRLYAQEMYLLNRFNSNTVSEFPINDKQLNPSLTEEQLNAVRTALTNNVSVITGEAGTGKSFVIASIVEQFKANEKEVAICAPTGKAARRLLNDGIQAYTIHKTLCYNPFSGKFEYDIDNKIPVDAVIVDEVSMCAISLLYSLISATSKTTQIILVGDSNQLPPIGAGNTLKDLCDLNIIPVSRLTKCHRNAGILKQNCTEILTGKVKYETLPIDSVIIPQDYNLDSNLPAWSVITTYEDAHQILELLKMLQTSQFEAWGFNSLTDCQIITPQNNGTLGVENINRELQKIQQAKLGVEIPPPTRANERLKIMVGDKVMQIKNNYGIGGGLMNGTQGVVLKIASVPKKCALRYACEKNFECANCKYNNGGISQHFIIQFDDRDNPIPINIESDEIKELVLAYACTVHKVQGSQFPCVVSIVHKAHTYMLSRNLLYTAVTRARFSSIVLGDSLGIRRAATTKKHMERWTWTRLQPYLDFDKTLTIGTDTKENNDINNNIDTDTLDIDLLVNSTQNEIPNDAIDSETDYSFTDEDIWPDEETVLEYHEIAQHITN